MAVPCAVGYRPTMSALAAVSIGRHARKVKTLDRRVELSYEGHDQDVWAAYEPHADQFFWTD